MTDMQWYLHINYIGQRTVYFQKCNTIYTKAKQKHQPEVDRMVYTDYRMQFTLKINIQHT